MRRESGFTLLEVLIAVTITVLVLAAIYGIFNGVSQARTKVEARSEVDHRGRVIFDRIGRELRGGWRPQSAPPFFTLGVDRDGRPDLRFATASTTLAATGRGGIAAIRYSLKVAAEGGDGTLTLVRSEEPYYRRGALEELAGYPLCGGVRSIRWRLYNGESWQESWQGGETSRLPQLVELTLVLREGEHDVTLRGLFDLPATE